MKQKDFAREVNRDHLRKYVELHGREDVGQAKLGL